MNVTSSISCPVCGEILNDNVTECPNCGSVLQVDVVEPPPKRRSSVTNVRRALHDRSKRANRVAVEKDLDRQLRTAAKPLEKGNYSNALKIYQAARSPASQMKQAKLFAVFLDLLEQSAQILISQQKALEAAPKHHPQPQLKSSRSLLWVGGLAFIPLFLLACIGLFSLLDPLIFGPGTQVSPTETVITVIPPSAVPTVTSGPTSIPEPVQLFNNNIDKIQDLFHWSAGENIESLSFSPDGEFIVSGDGNGKVRIWRLWTDELIFELNGTHAVFSPNGKWIGVAGPAGLDLYAASDGEWVRSLDDSRPYHSVLFSPDSQLIVGGANFDKFFIWSVNDGAEQKSGGGFNGPIHSLAFSQDGLFLAVASNENTYIWNLQEQKIERSVDFPKQKPVYYTVTLDSHGEWFAMGHEDGQMYIWRVSNGERMAVLSDESRFVHGLQFLHGSNDPEILVSGDEVNLSFWVMEGYETHLSRSIYVSTPILSLTVSAENNVIATGGRDGVIHLWGVMP